MKKLTLLSMLPVAALLSVIFVLLLYKYLHIAKLPSVKSLEFTGQRWYEQSFPMNLSDHTQLFPHDTEVHYRLKPSVQRLLPSGSCSCEGRNALQLEKWFSPSEVEGTRQRRWKEMQEFLQRQDPVLKKILVARPNSPLSYPTQGLQVPPTKTILIPGLSLYADKRDIYTVTLSAKLGVLDTVAEVGEVTLEGLGESRLSLSSPHLENLNLQLRTVTYTNTVYQPGTSEMVQLESGKHRADIPIVVAHQTLPRLYDPGSGGGISQHPPGDGVRVEVPLTAGAAAARCLHSCSRQQLSLRSRTHPYIPLLIIRDLSCVSLSSRQAGACWPINQPLSPVSLATPSVTTCTTGRTRLHLLRPLTTGGLSVQPSCCTCATVFPQLLWVNCAHCVFHSSTLVTAIKTRFIMLTFQIYNQGWDLQIIFSGLADGKISNLVTVVTKTFLRYDKLKGLIASIRRFYPDITIIVADDSEHIEMLHEPGVEQYIMPYGKGWFAGRNLAISQVMTKYLLWVDDDFLFSENTKLERMVEVLEKSSLDVVRLLRLTVMCEGSQGQMNATLVMIVFFYCVGKVGGVVSQNAFQHVFKVVPGDSDGDCLYRTMSTYRRLDGFPTCSLVDMVVNFFLARTENMRSVSFDPQFSRIGHPEFFIDGLGKLRVGTCRDISIDHAPKKGNMAQYNRYRHAKEARSRTMRALFFKNHLMCYRT
ncbi:beta-1,4 N-acetylgalactosaminyltransferase 1-like isoform X2 [Petromyzon marinus]|uniref:beta-1,4 N-acetylgalactosaminyltransferase 1-like isoform X2 n=1 Tax=Petromyzon marinus TaxID=7757 RepID=UPI003F71D435